MSCECRLVPQARSGRFFCRFGNGLPFKLHAANELALPLRQILEQPFDIHPRGDGVDRPIRLQGLIQLHLPRMRAPLPR